MDLEMWRAIVMLAVKQARAVSDDQEALELKALYKEWDQQLGRQLEVGEYVQYGDKLYRVLQAHTAQSNWTPGEGTESLFVVIDKEHAGTLEDPIPWSTNMECFTGKYYTENGHLYLCIRDSGIALHYDIASLVGNYFELVE